MYSPRPHSARRPLMAAAVALTLLYACQDTPPTTEPELATAAVRLRLTVKGIGGGSGVVTSSPAGIKCTITAGVAGTTGCSALFDKGTVVRLTAVPKTGHVFSSWYGACVGGGACKVSLTVSSTVTVRFIKGPFTIGITSGTAGVGSGRVTSQAGRTPPIDCTITNGTTAALGCSAKYPAQTEIVLTATPAAGFVFVGWGAPCAGALTCRLTVTRNATIAATFKQSAPSTAATMGRWDAAFSTPVVAVHTHLLPTGRLLLWGDRGAAQLWNPANPGAGFTALTKTYRIFCSGHTFLPDGRLLVTGGTITGTAGDPRAVLFDPTAGVWGSTGSMAQGRYYPTTTVLPSGEVLAVSGSDESRAVVTIPEISNGSTWRRLTSASLEIPSPYYPPMFVAPNGKVFLAGFLQTSRYLDVSGTGAWTTVADRQVADRRMGSAVMYAPGKVLYVGGGDPPTNSAEVIDLNEPAPAWRMVSGMAFARRQLNLTILADGQILVTHGTSGSGFNDMAGAVRAAELWNPATASWSTMAAESRSRAYHSTALLLPDARVLSSGSGEGGGVTYENSDFTAQVFSPPYLFAPDGSLAPRPKVTSAPARISYGQSFGVETPDAGSVRRGTLVRLSSVTHAFNQSQLIYPLTFQAAGPTSLIAAGPPRGALAPPGPYMLFLLNGSGVPSVARMVTIGP